MIRNCFAYAFLSVFFSSSLPPFPQILQNTYGFALVDGYKEKVGNFRVEPPNLFRGRGDHPKTGTLKKRVRPEDIIINISQGMPIPKPPEGHKWKGIIRQ